MTYPPQPPDPYGQQPQPGGYPPQQPGQYGQPPQPGGYPPHQPGQHGQQPQPGGYPPQQPPPPGYPQQGPPDQFGQPGGFDEPPPTSKKGPIIATVVVVLLLLGALGVTGFWQPGFFLAGDDDGEDAGEGTVTEETEAPGDDEGGETDPPKPDVVDTTEPEDDGGDEPSGDDEAEVRRVAEDLAVAFTNKDEEGASELLCDPDEAGFEDVPDDATMTVTGDPAIDGDRATIQVELASESENVSGEANLVLDRQGDGWCASDFE